MTYPKSLVVYIYILLDPETKEPRYVGQAIDPKRRAKDHVYHAKSKEKSIKASWITSLLNKGLYPEQKVIACVDANKAHLLEDYWMDYYRAQGYRLTNAPGTAKAPCRNRPQTDAEIKNNREKQLDRIKNNRTVPYHGVHICKQDLGSCYRASLRIKTKRYHLGQWDNPEDAARAWDSAMAYYFPNHQVFNFPNSVVPLSLEQIKQTTTSALNKTSKYKGISLVKKSGLFALVYLANGVRSKVATFETEEIAAQYWDSLERYYNTVNPKLNFPNQDNPPMSTEEVRKISRQIKGLDETKTSKYKNVFYQKREDKWAFEINGYRKAGFKTENEAATAFNTYITKHQINKPLLVIN